ncbi:MAG: nicotinate (nicotinamide) nucleotide adenylyltransferase [bacterium]|nr:nicotinate (nicotinamide) nucleotide adenylyltransferase [bacterium]
MITVDILETNFHSKNNTINDLNSNKQRRIGLLGGSFDPVHLGHIRIARISLEKISLDQVFFVPAAIPPHKQHVELSDQRHRLKMLQLALANEPAFCVSDVELRRQGVSYTIDTIYYFNKKYHLPPERLFLIIGADNLTHFHQWKAPEKILQNCQLLVYRRPEVDLSMVDDHLKSQLQVIDAPLIDISASDIREKIASGQDISQLAPPEIIPYIFRHHLYH